MRIIYADNNYFTIYDCEAKLLQTVYDSLDQILLQLQAHDYLLLPEDHFVFTSKTYLFYANQTFTLSNFKSLLQEYVIQQKKQLPYISQLLYHDTHSIVIDGSQADFLLGRKWQIRFQLDCTFWSNNSEVDFLHTVQKKVTLLPCSYGALKHCNTLLADGDYSILYINNTESKLILVKNQFYQNIQLINFWKDTLKLMYQEHNLLKYYRDPNSTTPVSESIVKDITSFFAEKIIDWLSWIIPGQSNLIIISDITKNTYFMESLKMLYSKFINGYILPMSLPSSEAGLPVDIATTLEHIHKKTIAR